MIEHRLIPVWESCSHYAAAPDQRIASLELFPKELLPAGSLSCPMRDGLESQSTGVAQTWSLCNPARGFRARVLM